MGNFFSRNNWRPESNALVQSRVAVSNPSGNSQEEGADHIKFNIHAYSDLGNIAHVFHMDRTNTMKFISKLQIHNNLFDMSNIRFILSEYTTGTKDIIDKFVAVGFAFRITSYEQKNGNEAISVDTRRPNLQLGQSAQQYLLIFNDRDVFSQTLTNLRESHQMQLNAENEAKKAAYKLVLEVRD